MLRKFVLAAMALALPVALLAGIDPGAATAGTVHNAAIGPVTFVGNISCNLKGTMTFSPPVTSTSVDPYTITFKGTNNKCVGLGTTSLSQGLPGTTAVVTLKKSTESFSFTTTAGPNSFPGELCGTLESGGPLGNPVPPFPIIWSGSGGTITPTTATFPLAGTVAPGVFQWLNGVTTGSFAGTTDLLLGYNLASVFTACAAGGPGIATLPVDDLGGDNLMVGPAF
jgi:hypothetical protein